MEGIMTANECYVGLAPNHTKSESGVHHSSVAAATALCANLLRTQDKEDLDSNPSQKDHQRRVVNDDIECHEAERKTTAHQASMYKERIPTQYPSDDSLTPLPAAFANEQYPKDAWYAVVLRSAS